jgi:hypothetical protein
MNKLFFIIFMLFLFATTIKGQQAHERIKVSDNGRYLILENGQPFFWLGDTGWQLFHSLSREETNQYVANRAANGYNAIQCVLIAEIDGLSGNFYGHLPLNNGNASTPRVIDGDQNDYWDHVDYIVNKIRDANMYSVLLPAWGSHTNTSGFSPAQIYEYGRFLGQRYQNRKDIIWVMGGDREANSASEKEYYRALAEGIADGNNGENNRDGQADYSTLTMTYHPYGQRSSSMYFHNDAWMDFNMHQSGHHSFDQVESWSLATNDWNLSPVKPTLNAEPCYENINSGTWSGPRHTDYTVRKAAYRTVFAGSAGFTYGHSAIWQFTKNGSPSHFNDVNQWYDGLNWAGALHMKHLKNLMLSRPYFTRIPDQAMLDGEGNDDDHMRATRSSDGSYALIYFPKETLSKTIRMGNLTGTQVKAWWYNPRDGKCYNLNGQITAQPFATYTKGDRSFSPPGSNSSLDWVLVLDDAAHPFGIPGQADPPVVRPVSP